MHPVRRRASLGPGSLPGLFGSRPGSSTFCAPRCQIDRRPRCDFDLLVWLLEFLLLALFFIGVIRPIWVFSIVSVAPVGRIFLGRLLLWFLPFSTCVVLLLLVLAFILLRWLLGFWFSLGLRLRPRASAILALSDLLGLHGVHLSLLAQETP